MDINVMDILKAFLVVSCTGVVLGILLALASRFFGVEEDEKQKKVRAALPGANCGACGFKGCNDYAEALAKGLAEPNLCVPGGESTAKELSEILGVNADAKAPVVALVHCNAACTESENPPVYDGIDSCRARSAIYGGLKACTYGCLGCGDCAKVCPANAIHVANGVARVTPELCIGCGLCTKTCPKHIISMVPKNATTFVYCSSLDKGAVARKACKNACIGCKKCEKNCPSEAIKVVNNLAVIDYTKCTGCGACVEGCPTGCLKDQVIRPCPASANE